MFRLQFLEPDSAADPQDNLSLGDRAKLEKKIEKAEEKGEDAKLRPTEVALSHGNKPSRCPHPQSLRLQLPL